MGSFTLDLTIRGTLPNGKSATYIKNGISIINPCENLQTIDMGTVTDIYYVTYPNSSFTIPFNSFNEATPN